MFLFDQFAAEHPHINARIAFRDAVGADTAVGASQRFHHGENVRAPVTAVPAHFRDQQVSFFEIEYPRKKAVLAVEHQFFAVVQFETAFVARLVGVYPRPERQGPLTGVLHLRPDNGLHLFHRFAAADDGIDALHDAVDVCGVGPIGRGVGEDPLAKLL